MGDKNNELSMYRTPLGSPKKKKLPSWTNQKSGEVAKPDDSEVKQPNVFRQLNKGKAQESGDYSKAHIKASNITKKPTPEENGGNVFNTLKKYTTKISPFYSGKAAGTINKNKLKVNPKYQSRVNKILGD